MIRMTIHKKRLQKAIHILLCLILIMVGLPTFDSNATASENAAGSKIMVSMGDSYSSGEGIEKFYHQDYPVDEKVKDQDWLAHRSEKSWSGRLKLPALSKQRSMSEFKDTNWFFVASSGAETVHINNEQKKEYNYSDYKGYEYLKPQIDVFKTLEQQNKKADYVTMTLGGNDADFVGVIESATIKAEIFNPSALADKLNAVWIDYYKSGGIRDKLHQTYETIAEKAGPQAKIIVAGYPSLIYKHPKGFYFTESDATMINDSVHRFNLEIKSLVNSCKAEGMKICFVSVEEKFEGREAYSADEAKDENDTKGALIQGIKLKKQAQDLDQGGLLSAYSMHPNAAGAKVYADCVQEKINAIENDDGKSEWPTMTSSDIRDVTLVLDASGSMSGTPMEETKTAAERFTDTALYEDVGIGIVIYDNKALTISDFSKNPEYLKSAIQSINSGGGTNIEAGLSRAYEMFERSHAKNKYIVLMSDGEPNDGKVGEELIAYADSLKDQGIRIYTLGFFSNLSNKTSQQALMEKIASDGCHYEVDDAKQLAFFFDDIAEQIKGTKYYFIRIACPVDVKVKYNGETLSSKNADSNQRTGFGTLTFEENPEEIESDSKDPSDNRIKTLRLKEGANYNIEISGNGKGKMNYTIGFMDENGEYSDLREFSNIKISKRTEIATVASNSNTTTLRVDDDGNGKYDLIYQAKKNSRGRIVDYTNTILLLLAPVCLLFLIILILIFVHTIKKRRSSAKKKSI